MHMCITVYNYILYTYIHKRINTEIDRQAISQMDKWINRLIFKQTGTDSQTDR